MMDDQQILLLDVGGTAVKYAVSSPSSPLGPVRQKPTNGDSADAFFETLQSILTEAGAVHTACFSIGGPFDYQNGISHMTHKFTGILEKPLKPFFEERGIRPVFLHDSTAYVLGEYHDGALKNIQNGCCVMLGTGLGFAWIRDGRACLNEKDTPSLVLWSSPYRDGIAEDYVSTRAIQKAYGQQISVKAIAEAARAGDRRASDAFLQTGEHLKNILEPHLTALGIRKLALGGQISRSADLLGLQLTVPWEVSPHPEDGGLRGERIYAALGRERCTQVLFPKENRTFHA